MRDLAYPHSIDLPRGVRVEWYPKRGLKRPGICTSIFPDGSTVGSTPHAGDVHYRVISHRCGYGDDVEAYCLEHDVAHHLVAHWLLGEDSAVLKGLAHGIALSGRRAAYEEMMAQAFQRWLRAGERPIVGGCSWDDWKADALAILDGA